MAGCGRLSRVVATATTLGSAAVLAAGCGSGGPASAAQPSGSAAPAATASAPAATASAATSTATETADSRLATGSERRKLAARYLAIARAGNRGLDRSLDPLGDRDKSRLGPARADLRYAANVEHTFDRRLLQIPFPPETEDVARTLYRVNEARASLTEAASRATSVGELHSYERRLDEANKPVEAAVRTIRRQLGLPPPPSS
jgi:hypothetical protein